MFDDLGFFPHSSYYDAFQIDPNVAFTEQVGALRADMFQVIHEKDQYLVHVGWYPEHDPEGNFVVSLIRQEDSETILHSGRMVPGYEEEVLYFRATRDFAELRGFMQEGIDLINLLTTDYIEWKKKFRDGEEEEGEEKEGKSEKGSVSLPYLWCLVGNVVEGTNVFSLDTKVYCFPVLWGDGYKDIKVIGRPRGSKKLVMTIVASKHITNWRVEKVYTSYIIKKMLENRGWNYTLDSLKKLKALFDAVKSGPSES
ncbi:hypothetical protein [Brevibacillus dissolubilis]|uniref:hypothetical protein n=1 Tax=Brevibacillus dissolubilis TaxID=1844116 RepID=UPI0011173590|nr:hypothetical protein [Brevibacillus dissolubilis]